MSKAKTEAKAAASTEVAALSGAVDLTKRTEDVGKGSETVGKEDLAIPRIKLMQLINREVQPSKAEYIEGAQPGMFLNTVSSALSNMLFVVNLSYRVEYVIWKTPHGSGKVGSFPTEEAAQQYMTDHSLDPAGHEISRNPMHYVLLLRIENGETKYDGVAILDMPSVKARRSAQWNTQIHNEEQRGKPRFGCIWRLKAVEESGKKGDYYNIATEYVCDVPDTMYGDIREFYNAFGTEDVKAQVEQEAA